MHSLLKDYMAEVAARLAPLPVARRNEELREMRQHLLNAVTVNREVGGTEDEAAQTALQQFGAPEDSAGHIVWAWRREKTLYRRNFWGAAAATPVILFLLFFLLTKATDLMRPLSGPFFLHDRAYIIPFVDGEFTTVFTLTGALAGSVLPRMAVRGVSLGLVIFACIWQGEGGFTFPTEMYQFLAYAKELAWLTAALLSAWASSRWRTSRLRRRVTG